MCSFHFRDLDFGPLPQESYKPELLSMTLPGYADTSLFWYCCQSITSTHNAISFP